MAKYVIIKQTCVIKNYDDVSHIWLFSGIQRKKAHKLHNKLRYDENSNKTFVTLEDVDFIPVRGRDVKRCTVEIKDLEDYLVLGL